MNMMVSGISEKEGKRVAYVLFEEDTRKAEAIIPECRIISNDGFSKEEVYQLEEYMKNNLAMLKQQAAGIHPIKAMMKD